MCNDFMSSVSIEEFAAYLDRNLSDNEMQRVSSIIENDEVMHNIASINRSIEDSLINNESLDLSLPDELSSLDFNIPQFDETGSFQNNMEDLQFVACESNIMYDEALESGHSSIVSNHTNDEVVESIDSFNSDLTQEHDAFGNNIPEINE